MSYRRSGKSSSKRRRRGVGKRRRRRAVPANLKNAIIAARETGYVNTSIAGMGCDTTGSTLYLAQVAQGTSVNQRVGKAIKLKGLTIRAWLVAQGSASRTNCTVLLVYDKRPTGTDPVIGDVLEGTTSFAMNNDQNRSRFRVLRRWDILLTKESSGTSLMNSNSAATFMEYVDLKGLMTLYKDGTGNSTALEEGGLWLMTVGSDAPLFGGDLGGETRLRYHDV